MEHTVHINPDKQTVAQILPAMESGGVERDVFHTAIAIRDAGFNSVVISEGGVLAERLKRHGVTHITLPVASKNPLIMYANKFAIERAIKKYGIKIIHARSRAPAYSAYWAAKSSGVKLITTFHGCYKLGMLGLKRKYNGIMAKGDVVTAVSDFVKNYVVNNYPIAAEEVKVIKDGVDLETFSPEKVSMERRLKTLDDFGVDGGKKIILLPSRMTAIKGHDMFIKAVAELAKRRDDFVCVLMGKAKENYRQKIIAMTEKYGLQKFVRLMGTFNDISAAYICSDIVVSSTIVPEAFGLTIAEAQAMGRIVVAPDFGGTAEIVHDGVDGFLYKIADVKALEKALDTALSLDYDRRQIISTKAVDNIKNNFTINRTSAETVELYRSVLR